MPRQGPGNRRKATFRKSRSIKGELKKNTSAVTGRDLVIQPCVVMRRCDFAFSQVHRDVAATPSVSDADKQSGCAMPTMVLSETRGLLLFLVVRGGIRFIERLAA